MGCEWCAVQRINEMSSISYNLRRATLGLLCATALGAWANGTPFFFPQGRSDGNNPNALVYVGNIKDTQGRYVDEVQVLVIAEDLGMTIPVKNDRPGHYRTPDVHGWIENLGGKVNPEKIRIDIRKRGYVLARPVAIPRRTTGVHSVDILLKPTGTQ